MNLNKQTHSDKSSTRSAQPQQAQARSAASKAISKHFGLPPGHLRDDMGLWVDVALCDDSPFQNRSHYDAGEIEEMKDDLDANGQLQAGKARPHPDDPDRYQLAFAHKRKRGISAGGNAGSQRPNPEAYKGKIRLDIEPLNDVQMVRALLSENNARSDVPLLDKAQGYKTLRTEITKELIAHGQEFEAEKGEKDGIEIEGKTYPLAPWRVVAEHGKVSFQEMQRVSKILELPKEWLNDFRPDKKKAEKFVFNSRHGRLLVSLRNEPKLQERIHRQIREERLTATEAEERAKQYRLAEPTALDLGINAGLKKARVQRGEQSRETARAENKQALSEGRSHLSAVPADESNDTSGTSDSQVADSWLESTLHNKLLMAVQDLKDAQLIATSLHSRTSGKSSKEHQQEIAQIIKELDQATHSIKRFYP